MESIFGVTENKNCLQTVYKVQENSYYFIDISSGKRLLSLSYRTEKIIKISNCASTHDHAICFKTLFLEMFDENKTLIK